MDVGQALKDAENALRDFIALVLEDEKGADWINDCGVSNDRVSQWKGRQEEDQKRLPTGAQEARLIYYADFYDLGTILKKNWSGKFSDAFGKFKTIDVFLDQLERLRNPDAHRRELLSHQKHLAIGIAGDLRNRIARYRSSMETSEGYYPRIESVADNYGNSWAPGGPHSSVVPTSTRLRIGDHLEFVISATDPEGEDVEYAARIMRRGAAVWQADHVVHIDIGSGDIGRHLDVNVLIRSSREYHAHGQFDDQVIFRYEVLPPRSAGAV